jgi:hypothetical protein
MHSLTVHLEVYEWCKPIFCELVYSCNTLYIHLRANSSCSVSHLRTEFNLAPNESHIALNAYK